jgi:hypothetical protein
LITTITLLARALSLTPRISSQVITATMANAGRFRSTGIPKSLGAVSIKPDTAGSALSDTAR